HLVRGQIPDDGLADNALVFIHHRDRQLARFLAAPSTAEHITEESRDADGNQHADDDGAPVRTIQTQIVADQRPDGPRVQAATDSAASRSARPVSARKACSRLPCCALRAVTLSSASILPWSMISTRSQSR